MNRFKIRLLLFIVLPAQFLFGQETTGFQVPDSLQGRTLKELSDVVYATQNDFSKAILYAKAYLIKAKESKENTTLANAYYLLSTIHKDSLALQYSDSIITITKDNNTVYYPAFAYFTKADIYYDQGHFKNALDNYIKANEYAIKNEHLALQYTVKHRIGILKGRLGEHKEALSLIKESLDFNVEMGYHITNNDNYLALLFALADAQNRNQTLDSASETNILGFKESLKAKNLDMSFYFVLNEGVNQFYKGNYQVALDSIEKSLPTLNRLNDKANICIANYYQGKIHGQLGHTEKSLFYFKKVDNIFTETKEIMPVAREAYEKLINYYKETKDQKNQLLYIEKLMSVDSILTDNYKFINKKIVDEYDMPKLISEKKQLAESLNATKKNYNSALLASSAIIILICLALYFQYRKRRLYKIRFEQLLNENNNKQQNFPEQSNNKEIKIADDLVKTILNHLEKFENNKEFLTNGITTHNLAEKMNTNSKYLSKVVNFYKKQSFTNYLNELRINYTIETLKTNPTFRKYSVKAIAEEVGFGNTDSFTNAFKKKTGITPFYFIKELERKEKQTALEAQS